MRVFVTGGNGFIGRHVVRDLSRRNLDVISFDIVDPVERLPRVQYMPGTVLDEFSMGRYMRGCDAVLHLAGFLGVARTTRELLTCMTINVNGTQKVLEAAAMAGVKKILLASSSEVFGEGNGEKLHENSPFNPKSGYAVSKLAAEQFVQGFAREYGMAYQIVRFFNIYGPGQVAEFVIPRFVRQALANEPVTVFGDGSQIRSFCHAMDAAHAVADLVLSEACWDEIFHVGNDNEPVSMLALARVVVEIAESSGKPSLVPFPDSDRDQVREIFQRTPDIGKLRGATGYEPRIDLAAGIRSVIESGDIPDRVVVELDRDKAS